LSTLFFRSVCRPADVLSKSLAGFVVRKKRREAIPGAR
jgi:hypothetical protein